VSDYDFTGEDIGPIAVPDGERTTLGPSSPDVAGISVRDVRHRETTRRWLAMALVGLFSVVTLLSLMSVVFEWVEVDSVKSLLEVLIPPIVALTGSALGFYFGVERSSGG
jgi:hypothetical protein